MTCQTQPAHNCVLNKWLKLQHSIPISIRYRHTTTDTYFQNSFFVRKCVTLPYVTLFKQLILGGNGNIYYRMYILKSTINYEIQLLYTADIGLISDSFKSGHHDIQT